MPTIQSSDSVTSFKAQTPLSVFMESPLLSHSPLTTPSSTPTSTIVLRIASFLLLFSISLYANYENSKNFDVTILNSNPVSVSTKRFHLMFVSNGRASRFVLDSGNHVKRILYPTTAYPQKQIKHVFLQLATQHLPGPEPVKVEPGSEPGNYVISLSPGLVMGVDARRAVEAAVLRAMARVWAWEGPPEAVDAVVDGLSGAGLGLDPMRWAELNREILLRGSWNVSTSAVGQGQVI